MPPATRCWWPSPSGRTASCPTAMLARFGGDEFAVLLPPNADADEPSRVARRLLALFDRPFEAGGARVTLGASIGIAVAPEDGARRRELLRCADIALYRAKRQGRGTFRFFEASMDAEVRKRAEIEHDLRRGDRSRLAPAVLPAGRRARGRRDHRLRGRAKLVASAVRRHSAGPVDRHRRGQRPDHRTRPAISSAPPAATPASWPRDLTLSFNLSPLQLADSMLALRVIQVLGETGLAPNRLAARDQRGCARPRYRRRKAGARRPSTRPASRSPSTPSAPAIRASTSCANVPSTGSRSTAPSSVRWIGSSSDAAFVQRHRQPVEIAGLPGLGQGHRGPRPDRPASGRGLRPGPGVEHRRADARRKRCGWSIGGRTSARPPSLGTGPGRRRCPGRRGPGCRIRARRRASRRARSRWRRRGPSARHTSPARRRPRNRRSTACP